MTEIELAEKVIKWLKIQGWQVFQEVAVSGSTKRLDIAALKGEKLWAIPCKRIDKKGVFNDAQWYKDHSNVTSVALSTGYDPDFHCACLDVGIGYIRVFTIGRDPVQELAYPFYRSGRTEDLFENLNPETADFAPAGMASGKRDTDFNVLMRDIADYLLNHSWSTVENAHDHIRDQSYTNRSHIIETFKLKVKKREFPGLYLRKGIVLREVKEVK